MVKTGFSKKDITPEKSAGLPLAGYFCPGRVASGIHDRLYARALAFVPEQGAKTALLSLDLLYLDEMCFGEICGRAAALGLLPENLLVCCTHTHSGFGGIFDTRYGLKKELIPLNGAFDRELVKFLADQCTAAIGEALEEAVPAKVRMNRGKIKGPGTNRHNPGLPGDDGLFTAEFLREDRKKITLYNLSCHPTVLNAGNRLLSADFPGAAAALLENGSICDMAVFANGSAGDMSARFTRRESSFAECGRLGALVRDAVVSLSPAGEGPGCFSGFTELRTVTLSYHTVGLKPAEIPGIEAAEKNLDEAKKKLAEARKVTDDPGVIRKAEALVEGAEVMMLKARYKPEHQPEAIHVQAGIFVLNEQKILCSPFELFSSLGLAIKRRTGAELFGYVNSCRGYLADKEAFDNMDYEALFSDFARGEGEGYAETASALLQRGV